MATTSTNGPAYSLWPIGTGVFLFACSYRTSPHSSVTGYDFGLEGLGVVGVTRMSRTWRSKLPHRPTHREMPSLNDGVAESERHPSLVRESGLRTGCKHFKGTSRPYEIPSKRRLRSHTFTAGKTRKKTQILPASINLGI